MSNINTHCKNSEKRTGKSFEELHKWMDEPGDVLGMDHRRVRHDLSYIGEVKEKFKVEGVREFLRHIAEDYLATAEKWEDKICATEGCDKITWKQNKHCSSCIKKWWEKKEITE